MFTIPRTLPRERRRVERKLSSEERLRRDRVTAIVMLVIITVLLGLTIWLARVGGVPDHFGNYMMLTRP